MLSGQRSPIEGLVYQPPRMILTVRESDPTAAVSRHHPGSDSGHAAPAGQLRDSEPISAGVEAAAGTRGEASRMSSHLFSEQQIARSSIALDDVREPPVALGTTADC